jgi:hypothetical protein
LLAFEVKGSGKGGQFGISGITGFHGRIGESEVYLGSKEENET